MRIITGIAKGTRLNTLKGLDVRPTADRVKESLFSILENMVLPAARHPLRDAIVLDLFAGTGNLGLEALSRGAAAALFIDNSPASLAVIGDNIRQAGLGGLAEVQRGDSINWLGRLSRSGRRFTLVFVDPPYDSGLINIVLQKIDDGNIVEAGGLIVVEHSKHEQINTQWQNLQQVRTERYGATLVTILSRIIHDTTLVI